MSIRNNSINNNVNNNEKIIFINTIITIVMNTIVIQMLKHFKCYNCTI